MDKKQVPQDEGLLDGKTRDVCYALDENGNYVQVLSVGWKPKNEALSQALELINQQIEDAKQKFIDRKASPIEYWMLKNKMDIGILSDYTGFFKWTIKRHMKPNIFNNLSQKKIAKYAQAFNISIEELTNI